MLNLDEIKKRAEAATPGPWAAHERAHKNEWALRGPATSARTLVREDATFIAHARQDVPALVAEVERLREALRPFAQLGALLDGGLAALGTVPTVGRGDLAVHLDPWMLARASETLR